MLSAADREDDHVGSYDRAEAGGEVRRIGSSRAAAVVREHEDARAGLGALGEQVLKADRVQVSG
jgi:hypothetical protein